MHNCIKPWTEFNVEYHGAIGCCCAYQFTKDYWNPATSLNLEEYWNGTYFQRIREIILKDISDHGGCLGCSQYTPVTQISPLFDNLIGYSKEQQKNCSQANHNFLAKQVVVDSLPTRYHFGFGVQCNLRCIMCSQEDVRKTSQQNLSFDRIKPLLKYIIKAQEVGISGGELFIINDAILLLKELILKPKFTDVDLRLVSNGTMLHKYIDLLRQKKRISLSVSLDSVGKTYEQIRIGANWEKTKRNILLYKETAAKFSLDWDLTVTAILMKSSLGNLPDFIDFCISNDISCSFQQFQPTRHCEQENIFENSSLLTQIPDWSDNILYAVEKFEAKGWQSQARTLKGILRKLEGPSQESKLKKITPSKGNLSEQLDLLANQLIVIWGSSSFYRTCIRDWALRSRKEFNIEGFVDNDSAKWGTSIDGWPVYSPSDIREKNPDVIIIASAMRNQIKKQIRKMKINCQII